MIEPNLKKMLKNIDQVPDGYPLLLATAQQMNEIDLNSADDCDEVKTIIGEMIGNITAACVDNNISYFYILQKIPLQVMEELIGQEAVISELNKYGDEILLWLLDQRASFLNEKDSDPSTTPNQLLTDILNYPQLASLQIWKSTKDLTTKILAHPGMDLELIKKIKNLALWSSSGRNTINDCIKQVLNSNLNNNSSGLCKRIYIKGLLLSRKPFDCPICQSNPIRPVILGCGHSVCVACFVLQRLNSDRRCSMCRKTILQATACI